MPEADLMEKSEEMERMREHVFNEVDLNRDRLIDWEEFKRMSEQPDFEKDDGWKTIDQNEIYTSEELKKFEEQRQQQIDQMIQNGRVSILDVILILFYLYLVIRLTIYFRFHNILQNIINITRYDLINIFSN